MVGLRVAGEVESNDNLSLKIKLAVLQTVPPRQASPHPLLSMLPPSLVAVSLCIADDAGVQLAHLASMQPAVAISCIVDWADGTGGRSASGHGSSNGCWCRATSKRGIVGGSEGFEALVEAKVVVD